MTRIPPPCIRRFFRLFAAGIFGTAAVFSAAGQETVYLPPEGTVWNNPYPGLGNALPSGTSAAASFPSPTFLFADSAETNTGSELPPTKKSGDLYLARIPHNKRTGIFQKLSFNTLWAANTGGADGLGITELDLSAMFALPMPTAESPFIFTPNFRSTFFDSKRGSKTFYSTGIDMRWMRPLVKNKLAADIGFGISYSGDFRAKADDTIRFNAHAAGIWDFNPRIKIVFGIAYLDKRNSSGLPNWLSKAGVIPMAGLIWTPNEDMRAELVMPRLRLVRRVRWFDLAADEGQSDWIYTALELGGGSWGYEYSPLVSGNVEYRDWRLLLGYERRTRCGLMLGLELGYMFERKMELERYGSYHPADSVFLRLRTSY